MAKAVETTEDFKELVGLLTQHPKVSAELLKPTPEHLERLRELEDWRRRSIRADIFIGGG